MPLNNSEKTAISIYQQGLWAEGSSEKNLEENKGNLLNVGINIALQIGDKMQNARMNPRTIIVEFKPDGSRVTNVDKNGEVLARRILANSFPDHSISGEEFGGEVDPENYTWAIDPIDATNPFISHETTSAVSIALMKDNKPVMSIVYNPFSGELFYTFENNGSRLIRHTNFSGKIMGDDLPLPPIGPEHRLNLVNVHPVPHARKWLDALNDARDVGEFHKILQTGGSPVLKLALITKGHFAAVLDWGTHEATPWDLASGIHIIRNAGGLVTDLEGNDVPLIGHKGVLIASIRKDLHELVLNTLRNV